MGIRIGVSARDRSGQGLQPRLRSAAGWIVRPVESPLRLGFLPLAGATATLSALELGWVPVGGNERVAVALLALFVPLQTLCTLFANRRGQVVVLAALGMLSSAWLAFGLDLLISGGGPGSEIVGCFLVVLAAALLAPASAVALDSPMTAGLLAAVAVRLLCSGIYEISGSAPWRVTAGWLGMFVAVLAVAAAWGIRGETPAEPGSIDYP
jgi:uncharacterized protein